MCHSAAVWAEGTKEWLKIRHFNVSLEQFDLKDYTAELHQQITLMVGRHARCWHDALTDFTNYSFGLKRGNQAGTVSPGNCASQHACAGRLAC
jgi:hypothetical protein